MESLHLVIAIADRENTERVIETFRESNVFTTDIVLGTGTAPTEILDYLYLSPNEKAVVFGVVTNAGLLPLLPVFPYQSCVLWHFHLISPFRMFLDKCCSHPNPEGFRTLQYLIRS